jgi:aldehyde:ferredoxin oxidoreductase
VQQYGLNISDVSLDDSGNYVVGCYDRGIIGPGKKNNSDPLPMDEIKRGTLAGAEAYCRIIANREGIGNDLAEGLERATVKWGNHDQDLKTGILRNPGYGIGYHHWLPNVYWAYASILSDRDINETSVQSYPTYLPVDVAIPRYAAKLEPYNDPFMLDCSWQGADGKNMAQAKATGVYSESKAKLVAWERHFEKFWMSSVLFCKSKFPIFFGGAAPDFQGYSPEMEVKFFNAVTGKNFKFTDGIELGRKIYNLNRAIWALQGRVREDEVFAEWMYRPGTGPGEVMPGRAEGQNPTSKSNAVYDGTKWSYQNVTDIFIDRAAFEEWKTKFYKFEGWDTKTGQPTRATLESLGMKNVADELAAKGKLGS